MEVSHISGLEARLGNLERLANVIEIDSNLPPETRQQKLTNNILWFYELQADYITKKDGLFHNPPEKTNPVEIRDMIIKEINPKEEAVFNRFKEVREKTGEYLDDKHIELIHNYIREHPVLSELASVYEKIPAVQTSTSKI